MKKIFSIIAVLTLVLSGCGSSSDVFTFAVKDDIESLDFAQATYQQSFQLYTDIYAYLVEVNQNGELTNGVAEDISISDDNLTYTIKLRDDAVWVDNTGTQVGEVTANDYVLSWQRMVDPSTVSKYAFIFEPIKNAEAITSGEKDKSELGVKAVDNYTLEVTLESPTPYFESMLAFPTFGAIPVDGYEQYGGDYASSPETTWYNGPYYVTSYEPSSEVNLAKNEFYYDAEKVQLPAIKYRIIPDSSSRYNAFKTGELDYAELLNVSDIEDAEANGTLQTDLTGYSGYALLNHNTDRVTSNENLRKALAYGFDREGIEEAAYGGIYEPIEYFIPAGITEVAYDGAEYRDYSNNSLITYDKDKADEYFNAYMKDMGYNKRSDIKIEYLSDDDDEEKGLAEAVQAHYLQTFGITVDITTLPFKQYVDARANGEFDMTIKRWGPDYCDPSTYLSLFIENTSNNYGDYESDEYNKLYNEAIIETDVDKRFTDFATMEQMLVEDTVLIPFYQQTANKVISDGYTVPSHLFLLISHKYVTYEE